MLRRKASHEWMPAPADHFTGKVMLAQLSVPIAPGSVSTALVRFRPCARSHWHTHPLGQTFIVTEGVGLHQIWGGSIETVYPGDVISVGPDEKH